MQIAQKSTNSQTYINVKTVNAIFNIDLIIYIYILYSYIYIFTLTSDVLNVCHTSVYSKSLTSKQNKKSGRYFNIKCHILNILSSECNKI